MARSCRSPWAARGKAKARRRTAAAEAGEALCLTSATNPLWSRAAAGAGGGFSYAALPGKAGYGGQTGADGFGRVIHRGVGGSGGSGASGGGYGGGGGGGGFYGGGSDGTTASGGHDGGSGALGLNGGGFGGGGGGGFNSSGNSYVGGGGGGGGFSGGGGGEGGFYFAYNYGGGGGAEVRSMAGRVRFWRPPSKQGMARSTFPNSLARPQFPSPRPGR